MGFRRNLARGALSAATLLLTVAASAAPVEPLVVTRLADPDPDFAVRQPGSKNGSAQSAETAAQDGVEDAMQTFGRAIGQAAMIEQQQIEARCRTGAPINATREQLFAYEASCRYSRH